MCPLLSGAAPNDGTQLGPRPVFHTAERWHMCNTTSDGKGLLITLYTMWPNLATLAYTTRKTPKSTAQSNHSTHLCF